MSSLSANSGPKSTFSHTVDQLSKYLKEKKRIPELRLIQPQQPPAVMDLFPQQAGFDSSINKGATSDTKTSAQYSASAAGHMTLFYGGKVIVISNLATETADQIFQIASEHSASKTTDSIDAGRNQCGGIEDEMPIARRGSLRRFFEKRRDRRAAAAPYCARSSIEKSNESERLSPWIGLEPRMPALDLQLGL